MSLMVVESNVVYLWEGDTYGVPKSDQEGMEIFESLKGKTLSVEEMEERPWHPPMFDMFQEVATYMLYRDLPDNVRLF